MYIPYNPDDEQHRELPLLEMRTVQHGQLVGTELVPTRVSRAWADRVPRYFFVEVSNDETVKEVRVTLRVKGGPGSGHHGHKGRPGKRGGSLPGKGTLSISAKYKPPELDDALIDEIDQNQGPWNAHELADALNDHPEFGGIGTQFRRFDKQIRRWVQGAEGSAKRGIASKLRNNPTMRTLTLYEAYNGKYARPGVEYPTFREWLNTAQDTFYRFSISSRIEGRDFISFALSKEGARDAANALSDEEPFVLVAKWRDVLGYGMSGIGETWFAPHAIEEQT